MLISHAFVNKMTINVENVFYIVYFRDIEQQ